MTSRIVFESRILEAEFASCLKQRVVPLKFAYVGNAARTHDELAKQASYQLVSVAADFESLHLVDYFRKQRSFDEIVEIGPGNGFHTRLVLQRLMTSGLTVKRYLGLDLSSSLLAIANNTLTDVGLPIHFSTAIWDFEKSKTERIDAWRAGNKPLLCFLLGHTLGNPHDPKAALQNIRNSLRPNDYLAISMAMRGQSNEAELIQPYLNPVFVTAATEPLRMAGIDIAGGQFSVRFDEVRGAIVGSFQLFAPQRIELGNTVMTIDRDESIECFFSRRLKEGELQHWLKDSGWSMKSASTSDSNSHVLAIVSAL